MLLAITVLAQAQQMGISPETVMGASVVVNGGLIALAYNGLAAKLNKLTDELAAVVAEQHAKALVLERIETTLHGTGGLVDRVGRLHDWKQDQTSRQLQAANDENARLRAEGHLHTRKDD